MDLIAYYYTRWPDAFIIISIVVCFTIYKIIEVWKGRR